MTEQSESRARLSPWVTRLLLIAAFFLALEAAARGGLVSSITLSAPSDIARAVWKIASSGELYPNLWRTMLETSTAFASATVIGVPLGLALWRVPYLARVLEPYLSSLYAMPLVFFYPLLLVVFGLGPKPVITVAGAMSTIPIVLNTRVGLTEIRPIYHRLGRTLGCSPWRTVRQILLPAAAPYLFVGLRMGFIYAFIGAIAMEFVLTDVGLGFMVHYNYNFFETPKMYAYMLMGILIASAINAALGWAERAILGRSGA